MKVLKSNHDRLNQMKMKKAHYAERYVLHCNILRAIGARQIALVDGSIVITPSNQALNRLWLLPPKGRHITRRNHPWREMALHFSPKIVNPGAH